MIKYFENIKSLSEAKELYRKYAKELHPDKQGGSAELFKEMSSQYAEFLKQGDHNLTRTDIILKTLEVIESIEGSKMYEYIEFLNDLYPDINLIAFTESILGIAKSIKKAI